MVIDPAVEHQAFIVSGFQQARIENVVGQAIIKGLIDRVKGARVHPMIDKDACEVRWPVPSEHDRLLQLLAAGTPINPEDGDVHRIPLEDLARELLNAWYPERPIVYSGPFGIRYA